ERGQTCSGCGLCAALGGGAVELTTVAPGYTRPRQVATLTPEPERAIAATCPGLVVDVRSDAPHVDPLWGPWRTVVTGYATDADLRHHASSGGVLSALLVQALAEGLVDYVVQTAMDPARPLANTTIVSTDAAGVFAAAGSRYAASSPLAEITARLDAPGRFAFVGKPCDVDALRALARIDPRVDAKVPLMLAFFCAGVPSGDGARRILKAIDAPEDQVTAFRYRGDGWPGQATATLRDGTTRGMSYHDSWGMILSKEIQFRCKICPDAVGAAADIACADAWYGDDKGYPSFTEQDGRSLVMVRTAAGQALYDRALAAGRIAAEPLDPAEIVRMQPSQARRKREILARMAAMAVAGRPIPRYRGLRLREAARQALARQQLRSFAGLVRRIVRGQA
ncbi:MAG: Coenzyme F420 hydrogenase/dehydrogenase, beta subunit C-terminal domain, partial [Sphingomonadaceae bacterium]|nr:Coenzyme F420 hydrogenase/dehydrogenase, beta subunit C-terminal domain [Sphingomonadaceae bacterium]